jgi:DNA-binding NarL/FixJ family response regulator
VQLALETKPDICLLEVRMPGGGVAAAWEIAARVPTTKIVMLTVSDADADFFSALRAGAVGYLLKDIDLRRLPRALRDAAEGTPAISPALIGRMLTQFRSKEPRWRRECPPGRSLGGFNSRRAGSAPTSRTSFTS